jgi:hypothetical protein
MNVSVQTKMAMWRYKGKVPRESEVVLTVKHRENRVFVGWDILC